MTAQTNTLSDELVEQCCFNWLRTLFPAKATDEEIRSRIKDTDREHVRVILAASGIQRLLERDERMREALSELEQAEAQYRSDHDLFGDGSSQSGRSWDLMRRAGNKARTTLSEVTGDK